MKAKPSESLVGKYINLILKGMGMGAANVIPGVSGGTIALITGIFEPLIHSLKNINGKALKLFFTGKWKAFAEHINLGFLVAVFAGIGLSIIGLARVLRYLFENHPVLVWAFFFGLIAASIYFVGKTITKWNVSVWAIFLFGAAVAVAISLFKPGQENDQVYYLLICGVVAVCSMILPGLSGSFVLLLMGNYRLVMIDSINAMDFKILIPVVIGAIIGLLAFSHILSWVFKKYKNQTIALLTGFMLGSLMILWPWKNEIHTIGTNGEFLLNRSGEKILEGYTYFTPSFSDSSTWLALACVVLGALSIVLIEVLANRKSKSIDA